MAIDYSTPFEELPGKISLEQLAAWLDTKVYLLQKMARSGRGLHFEKDERDNWYIRKSALYLGPTSRKQAHQQHDARREARALGGEAALNNKTATNCPFKPTEDQMALREEWMYMFAKTRKHMRMVAFIEGEIGTWA